MDPYQQQDPYQQRPVQKQGMGCFAKGCLTLFIVLALLVGIVAFVGYKGYSAVMAYVSDKPVSVRVYPATEAQYQAVQQKIQPFALALQNNQQATLELSPDDLNTLIARDPNFAHLRGKAYISMENDDLAADMSFPIDESNGHAATKYFNGRIVTGLSVANGDVILEPKRLEGNGQPTPGWLNKVFANKDFMRGVNNGFNESFKKNEKANELLSKLQSLQIKDSRMVVTSVGEPPVAAPAQ